MDKISLFHGQKFAIPEFSRHIEYDFLKEDHKNNFHTKNQEDSQRRLKVKGQKPSKLLILAKNGQILALNGQILAISEFSRHIHYDFLKEDHKGSFHTKNYENLQRHLEDIGQNGQIWPNFDHLWHGQIWPNFDHLWPFWGSKKFSTKKNLWWSSKSYGDTTLCEKLEKK